MSEFTSSNEEDELLREVCVEEEFKEHTEEDTLFCTADEVNRSVDDIMFVTNRLVVVESNTSLKFRSNYSVRNLHYGISNYPTQKHTNLEEQDFFNKLKNSKVLFFVHGFTNLPPNAMYEKALVLARLLNTDGVQVVAVLWPTYGNVQHYLTDRATIESSEMYNTLSVLYEKIGEHLEADDVHFLCHSMGGYVFQKTIPNTISNPIMNTLFLVAADIDHNLFEEGHDDGKKIRHACRTVCVLYNPQDLALLHSSRYQLTRLGLNGIHYPIPSVDNSSIVQCNCQQTEAVDEFHHTYFLQSDVTGLTGTKTFTYIRNVILAAESYPTHYTIA